MKKYSNYIPNYSVGNKSPDPENPLLPILEMLQVPCCVNIYASTNTDKQGYNEESRKGGLGKSLLIRKVYENNKKKLKTDYSIIDFSGGQYNTKASILKQVVDIIEENYEAVFNSFKEHKAYKEFRSYLPYEQQAESDDYDPSFVAEESFREFSRCKQNGVVETIYFDGYDRHHIGDSNAPLRKWLNRDLFPWLVHKMGLSIVVAGRDQLDNAPFKRGGESVIEVKVKPFDKDQVAKYLRNYLESLDFKTYDPKQKDILLKDIDTQQRWKEILDFTDGKPIFLDLFCTILIRDCLNNRFSKISFQELWSFIFKGIEDLQRSGDKKDNDDLKKRALKQFLVDRLYLVDNDESNNLITAKIMDAVRILSVAKSGLSDVQYKYVLAKVLGASNNIEGTGAFFEKVFTQNQLSYVKNRKGNVRLLHDEMAELLQEYYWQLYDKNHEVKNKYLDYIIELYDKELLPPSEKLRETSLEKYSRILEYVAYLFEYRDYKKEIHALDRFLYEFAIYLDSAPDMCRRLLGRAIRYYNFKNNPSEHERELRNTLNITENFDQLSKILTRETIYLLTERTPGWSEAVDNKIEDIVCGIEKSVKYPHYLRGIHALRGEQYSWQSGNVNGIFHLNKAKKGFYLMGELYGMNWVEHLLGFYYQRDADFERARKHHETAITDTIINLKNRAVQLENKNILNKVDKTSILLYSKTLVRAGSNLAVNLRYRGQLTAALRKLNSFSEFAQLVGTREKARIDINTMQFNAIIGLSTTNHSEVEKLKISDPVLPRRLILTELVQASKEGGQESRIHHLRREEFYKDVSKQDKVHLDKLRKKIRKLKENFIPVANLLNIHNDEKTKNNPNIDDHWKDKQFPPANRELADIYYQYGKIMLAYNLEGEASFGFAQTAFENCLEVARYAGFKYLVAEAMVTLSRLFYLQWRDEEAEKWIKEAEKDSKRLHEENQYAPYRDLLSNHDLTKGDLLLDINASEAVQYYFKMLANARWHNESRYHLALETFCDRIKYLLDNESISREKIEYIFDTLHDETKTHLSTDFLSTFLKAYSLKNNATNAVMYGLRKKMAVMMQKGKFVQAACINQCLIEALPLQAEKRKQENLEEDYEYREMLALRYFQKFYIDQWYNRPARAKEDIDEMYKHIKPSSEQNKINPFFIVHKVALATWSYRKSNVWNIEKFLLEEIQDQQLAKRKDFLSTGNLYRDAIEEFLRPEVSLSKPMKRIFTAVLYRLGQWFLMKGEENIQDWLNILNRIEEKIEKEKDMDVSSDNYPPLVVQNGPNTPKNSRVLESLLSNIEYTPAIQFLHAAYKLAKHVKDDHRAVDSLQAIVSACYYQRETIKSEWIHDELIPEIHKEIKSNMTDNNRRSVKYPFIWTKVCLTEGNIYFTRLFMLKKDSVSREYVAELRKQYEPQDTLTTALLHRMMWSYISALNVLSHPDRPYQSFHFENMLFEINRRIQMIQDVDIVRSMQTGLAGIWGAFDHLEPMTETLHALKQEMSLREVFLVAKKLLYKPSK